TDIENVPWGQKATYGPPQDNLSLAYIGRGSSFMPSSNDDYSEVKSQADTSMAQKGSMRPVLQSRHSFTTYEDKREKDGPQERNSNGHRPAFLSRSKSSYPASSLRQELPANFNNEDEHQALNEEALEMHDALEERQNIPSWASHFTSGEQDQGKVLDVLQ